MTVANGNLADATDILRALNASGNVDFAPSTVITIAAGVIVPTQTFHRIETEAAAATDDIDTITLPAGFGDGSLFIFRPTNDVHTTVFKHNTGNILCVGNVDLILDDAHDFLIAVYDSNLAKFMAMGKVGGTLTFTPTLGGSATNGTIAYGSQVGKNTRIGNVVFFYLQVRATDISVKPTGNLLVRGLPVAALSSGELNFPVTLSTFYPLDLIAGDVQLVARVLRGTTDIEFFEAVDNGIPTQLPATAFPGGGISCAIEVSGSYLAA